MNKWILALLAFSSTIHADRPVWIFTPLTPTTISVPSYGAGTIQYTVTNQSRKTHTLVMNSIQGITQDTSGFFCKVPFTLGYEESCTLKLNITGRQLTGNVYGGPWVCDQASQGLQCYQPSANNALNISIGSSEYMDIYLPSHQTLHCEIADTPEERAWGLMYRTYLEPLYGMIFIFASESSNLTFIMKNVLIPLDIIWLNHDKTIIYISSNTPPCTSKITECPTYAPPPNLSAQYVIEINGGLAQRLNLTPGIHLSF